MARREEKSLECLRFTSQALSKFKFSRQPVQDNRPADRIEALNLEVTKLLSDFLPVQQ